MGLFYPQNKLIVIIVVKLLSQHYFSVECNVQNKSYDSLRQSENSLYLKQRERLQSFDTTYNETSVKSCV